MNRKSRWFKRLLVILTSSILVLAGRVDLPTLAFKPPASPSAQHESGPQPASGWWETVQERIGRQEYEISWQEKALWDGQGAYQAPNRAHDLRTTFTPAGIHVVPRTESAPAGWEWGLSLTGYGDASGIQPVGAARLSVVGNRVEYHRLVGTGQRLVEWYVNDERGLEQGFSLAAPPRAQGGGLASEIVLELALSGNLTPHLVDGVASGRGDAIEFSTPGGVRVLRYSDLYAYDAAGRALPARLGLVSAGSRIQITLDPTGAIYPITIDPLAASPIWVVESNQAGAYFGFSVGTAGDVNNDGYDDLVVGAPRYDGGLYREGRAYVYHGAEYGPGVNANWISESNQRGAWFGYSAGTAGDVNGDGYDDIVVGAIDDDGGQEDEGRAYVYYGGPTGLASTAAWIAEGSQTDAGFGFSVRAAGDINRDGYDDLVVGAPFYSNGQLNEGRAYLYHGGSSGLGSTANWLAEGNQAHAQFGRAVGTAGDVNGDSYADIVVGALYYDAGQLNEGCAFVYHGGPSGLSSAIAWSAQGNQSAAQFGRSVGTAGDVNGDGYDDLVLGAPEYDAGQQNEGRVYVYHGSASGLNATANWTTESNQTEATIGWSVGTAGDVDGDGYDDVIVGASGYDGGQENEGRAYVYHGSTSGLNATAAWMAESDVTLAWFGLSVGTAGDVNGDSYDDVVVGAPRYSNGQTDEGRAYLFLGAAGGPPAPRADFTVPTRSGPAPLSVRFTDMSYGAIDSWSWDFGDGSTSSAMDPTHTYANPGTYTVSLTVSGPGGSDTETKSGYINVGPPPDPEFSASPRVGSPPLAVYFVDQSLGDISSWSWSFGDGSTSSARNPTHTYANLGSYTVSLTVAWPGGSNTVTKSDYIIVIPRPVADFTAAPRSGRAPLTVYFVDQSQGDIDSWSWSYGDGHTSTARNPEHTYASPGSYTVALTVSGPGGSDTETKSSYIVVIPPAPVADFTASTRFGPAPLSVQFTDQSTGQISNWSWSFGDGSDSTDRNPGHTYTTPGIYAVSLTVSGPGGSDTETKGDHIIVIPPPPEAEFIGEPRSGREPLTVKFTNQSTGQISNWSWNFGDGNTSAAIDPTHTYTTPGTYSVSLTVSGPTASDTETKSGYIVVDHRVPVAGFTASRRRGVAPLTVQFADLSTGQIAARSWSFGDGGTSTAQKPSHTYTKIGIYDVSLTVLGPGGQDTETRAGYIEVTELSIVYLPGVFSQWPGPYTPPCDAQNRYCEDNDTHTAAYGPLEPVRPYSAYPDDKEDYYYFVLDQRRTVGIEVTGFAPTSSYGSAALYGPAAGDERGPLIEYFGDPDEETMLLGPHTLERGRYYVRVYTEDGHFRSDARYALIVTY